MTDYIPKLATIEQSCEWLRARLGGVWILPRLLECHLKPYFWIDYKPGHPQIFGGKVEGYLTWMVFASDVHRLEVDGTNALVNIFTAHDGTLVKIEPGWTVPLSDLRFKREALERVASILEGEVSRQNPASSGAPESAEPPAESGVRKEGIAETPSRTTEKYKASWPTCTKHELIDCFLLTGKNWEDTLSRPSKYDSAKSQPGRKGKGGDALWFPITFAGLLVQHEEFTQSQVKTRFLKIAEWKKWESELLAEIGMI